MVSRERNDRLACVDPDPDVHGGPRLFLLQLSSHVENAKASPDCSLGVVLVGDHVYGYSDGRGWTCQNLKTGEAVWDDKVKVGRGSLTCVDGYLYCYAESTGEAYLVEAIPDSLKLKSKFKTPKQRKEGSIWTHPVVANGRLYLRDQDLIFCYDVRESAASAR